MSDKFDDRQHVHWENCLRVRAMTWRCWKGDGGMKYNVEINGLDVEADYSEKSIEAIFLPLLERLTKMQRQKGKRILVMLAAPPAAGKSTLASFLKYLSKTRSGLAPLTVIGMDGFHRRQDYLLTHTVVRDGKEVPMVKIKGAPVTFDFELLASRIARVAAGEVCGWPTYDRMLHNPVEDAISVEGGIVLLEGNYLLLDEDGWRELKDYADYTIKIIAEEIQVRKRLVERKCASGTPYEEAVEFVEGSDLVNVRTCLERSVPADLTLRLEEDGNYFLA